MFRTLSRVGLIAAAVLLLPLSGFAQSSGSDTKAQEVKGDPYSLNVCPVSGEKLGTMGDPIVSAHDGREVRFCCAMCPKQLAADPAKFFAKIDALMVKDQSKHYPLTTDLVTDAKLGEKPVDLVYNNRLVRLGDESSVAKFNAAPAKYLAKLDKAVIAKQSETYPFKVCMVSGEELGGDHGDMIDKVVANRLIRFCRNDCAKELNKTPMKFIAMVDSRDLHAGSEATGGSTSKE